MADLTPDAEFLDVTIQLLQDKHNPKVEGLALLRPDGKFQTITEASTPDAPRFWTVKREYKCRVTMAMIKAAAVPHV